MSVSSVSSSPRDYDVFLCHNSVDKPEVRQVYEALRGRGLQPWFDEADLPLGARWRPAIETAMTGTKNVAVFVGKAPGRVQDREIDICVNLESRGQLTIIPVILPGCVDDADIPPFLGGYSWIDFRQPGSDPLDRLSDGVRKVERSARPVVAVAPTTTLDVRSRLIIHCQNAGLVVPRAGIYPPETETAMGAFRDDLEECHVVALLEDAGSPDLSDAIESVLSDYPHPNRVIRWKRGGVIPSEFRKHVVDRVHRVFDANRPDPAMRTGQEESEPSGNGAAQKWAMVKYDRVDARPTREMLRRLKEANVRCTSSPNGETTLAERMRENPFDALILVLGQCDNTWLERRIDELIEVELTLKEQAPLQAYYYAEGATAVPPDVSPTTLEFDGLPELDRLIQAIRGEP